MLKQPIDWNNKKNSDLLTEALAATTSMSTAAEYIAGKLGMPITKNQVIGAVRRSKNRPAHANEYKEFLAKHTWNAERDQLLRKLRAEGFTDPKIAEAINTATGADFLSQAIRTRRSKLGLTYQLKKQLSPAKPRKRASDQPLSIFPKAAPTATHAYATCKWIDGDPKGLYSVCAQPAAVDLKGNPRPYCQHHCSIAYLKPGERRRETPVHP